MKKQTFSVWNATTLLLIVLKTKNASDELKLEMLLL